MSSPTPQKKKRKKQVCPDTIFGMKIHVLKKGKTCGRQRKMEKTIAKFITWYCNQPEVKEIIEKAQEDYINYGFAILPSLELKKEARHE